MICSRCGREGRELDFFGTRCARCHASHLAGQVQPETRPPRTSHPAPTAARTVIITTETAASLPVARRLGVIGAEAIAGMNIFKDAMIGLRNIVGGHSETLARDLKRLRSAALEDLRTEARRLGADAVVGVSIGYQDLAASGSTMLMVTATGTAVTLSPDES